MMMWPVTSLLAHLWHPKRANERQLPTNTVGRRARLDDGSGAFLPVAVTCNERPVRVESRRSSTPPQPCNGATRRSRTQLAWLGPQRDPFRHRIGEHDWRAPTSACVYIVEQPLKHARKAP